MIWLSSNPIQFQEMECSRGVDQTNSPQLSTHMLSQSKMDQASADQEKIGSMEDKTQEKLPATKMKQTRLTYSKCFILHSKKCLLPQMGVLVQVSLPLSPPLISPVCLGWIDLLQAGAVYSQAEWKNWSVHGDFFDLDINIYSTLTLAIVIPAMSLKKTLAQ